jgi:hypothetical protein
MNDIEVILDSASVIFQLGATYFGYQIYQYNRLSKWWLALVLAFGIQTIRRLITTISDLGTTDALVNNSVLFDRSLQLVISLLMFIGMWAMLKNFETFDVVEKKAADKIEKFSKTSKKVR